MMICAKCGIEYPAGRKFCRQCGGTLTEQVAAPAPAVAGLQRCPKCQQETPAGKKFCRACGYRLSAAPAAQMTCPACGAAVAPGKRFCGACGASLQAAPAPAPVEEEIAPEREDAVEPAAVEEVPEPDAVEPKPPEQKPHSTPTVMAPSPLAAMLDYPQPPPVAKVQPPAPPQPVPYPYPAPKRVEPEPPSQPGPPPAAEVPRTMEPEIEELAVTEVAAKEDTTEVEVEVVEEAAAPYVPSPAPRAEPAPKPRPEPRVPFAAPPLGTGEEEAPKSRLLLVLIIVVVVVAIGLAGGWYFFFSTEARIMRAINSGQLFAPENDSAYALYQKAKAANQLSASLQQKIRVKALDALSNSGETLLKKRTEVSRYLPQELEDLRRIYEWAFELAPDDAQVASRKDYVQGLLALVNEKPREAVEPLRASLDKNASWAPGWHDLGRAYAWTNDTERALSSFDRAVSLAPDWIEPQLESGMLYVKQQQWDLAQSRLKRATELDAGLATPWYFLARAYEGMNNCPEALRAYEKALELNTSRPASVFQASAVQERVGALKSRCDAATVAEQQPPPVKAGVGSKADVVAKTTPPPPQPRPSAALQVGTVATCSAYRGFADFTAKPQVKPGDSFCVYAEALNANRNGEVDLVFEYAILSPANVAVIRRSAQVAHRSKEQSVAWAADFRMGADAAPGIYTVTVTIRDNLAGQTQSKSAFFTVLPR